MHEGRLDIKSKPGEGTTVTCILPQRAQRKHANGAAHGTQDTGAMT
jgi:hypothetical protein